MQLYLQVFEHQGHGPFRVYDRNGDPWFVLADVCRELEIGNPSDAARRLDADEKATLDNVEGRPGQGAQSFTIISESGLYSLILTSRKDAAKTFKKWVTSEVLPSIRKTGAYGRVSIPAYIRRHNTNWDRVSPGYFSVIAELTIRVWGRLESVGHVMADKGKDGREIRPDVAVGIRFSKWIDKHHPGLASGVRYYLHTTPEWEGAARQYPISMMPLFMEYVDTVWLLKHAEEYLRTRDPLALPYLPKMLPSVERARPVAAPLKKSA